MSHLIGSYEYNSDSYFLDNEVFLDEGIPEDMDVPEGEDCDFDDPDFDDDMTGEDYDWE
jgi:hypothetical protein